MRWHDLLSSLDVVQRCGEGDVEVAAITHDSRLVSRGACFACIPGATYDGHVFAPAAVEAGAVALLVEHEIAPELLPHAVVQARVPSVRAALGPAAAALHGHPSRALRCLGVTGTNGKTTTTYLLEAVAGAAGEVTGVIGTVGARVAGEPVPTAWTTPEADELQGLLAAMRDAGVTAVAMEVSSHALAQHRVDGTWFAAACFTNLTHEHLDYHGSIDAYFEAKASLFDADRTGAAAVNIDDEFGRVLYEQCAGAGLDPWTFGIDDADADVTASSVGWSGRATSFSLLDRRAGQSLDVTTTLVGGFNVSNALAAAATARAAGFDLSAVAAGLSAPIVVPGRLERVDAGQEFTVLVDYAHTPDALERLLGVARGLAVAGGRVLVVFGCGGDRDRVKRPLMGAVAGAGADVAFVTNDNPRSENPRDIADAVCLGLPTGAGEQVVELDRRVAIAAALGLARAGDVVVVAGKGHETGQTIGGETRPFDDRTVAREELARLGWS